MIGEYLRDLLRNHPIKLALGTLGTASVCAVVGYLVLGRRKRWVKVGKVGKLYIFPLKSGAVTESEKLYFQSMGPRYDKAADQSEHCSVVFPKVGRSDRPRLRRGECWDSHHQRHSQLPAALCHPAGPPVRSGPPHLS